MLYEVSPVFILDLPDFCWHFPWVWKFWQFWKFGHFNIYWKVQIFCADATSPLWTCHGHITFYFFQLEVWSKKKRTFCIDPSWWEPKHTKLERESPKLRLSLFNLNLNRYDLSHQKSFFFSTVREAYPSCCCPSKPYSSLKQYSGLWTFSHQPNFRRDKGLSVGSRISKFPQ